jgi:hypothetical protein
MKSGLLPAVISVDIEDFDKLVLPCGDNVLSVRVPVN